MKVKIGKYPNRLICRIHDRYMNRKYGYMDWPEQQTDFEQFLEKLEDAVQTVYNLFNIPFLDKRKQSVQVHIDPWDTWSMDHTLAEIILPMLVQLKRTKHGAPCVDPEDVPENMRPGKLEVELYEKDGTTDALFFKRWDYVLDEMIWAFNEHTKDDGEAQFYSGEPDVVFEKIEGTQYSEMKRGPNDTFEIDWKGLQIYNDRKQNGFRLFGKYYTSLWD